MTEIDSVIGSIVSNLTPEMVTKKYREREQIKQNVWALLSFFTKVYSI